MPYLETTKPWEVSDEPPTDRFPHFQCLTLQCARMTLNLRLRGRVGSPRGRGRLTSEVAVGVGGGGVFPETILDLLVTFQTRPDPRPDPDLGPQLHILFRDNPPSTRPHTGECYRAVLSAFISLVEIAGATSCEISISTKASTFNKYVPKWFTEKAQNSANGPCELPQSFSA